MSLQKIFNLKKLFAISFCISYFFSFSQNTDKCNFEEDFAQNFYYYTSDSKGKQSAEELNKKLISSIFSLIKNETRLELSNVNGESFSDFSQVSIVRSESFLINPKTCIKDDGAYVVYVNKEEFNTSFLISYRSDLLLLENRITKFINTTRNTKSSKINRSSEFLKDEIGELKREYERLKFYLPFANSISETTYNSNLSAIYNLITELEIFSLSINDRITNLEQNYFNMDCKNALIQIKAITTNQLNKQQKKRVKKLRANIDKECKIAYKEEINFAKKESVLFNNLEINLNIQSYPTNTSNEILNTNDFNLKSLFLSGRLSYLIGVSDSGLRVGPYARFNWLDGALGDKDFSTVDFSNNLVDIGIIAKFRLIRDFIEFELGAGRSINEINALAVNNVSPFHFISISPGVILGNSKGFSVNIGVDYLAADNGTDYNYLTAKIGLGYNIVFKKIKKSERKKIKNKYN